MQLPDVTQSTAFKDPPPGTVGIVQVAPPSVDDRTAPSVDVLSPTATHCVTLAQDMPKYASVLVGRLSDDQVVPESVVEII